MNQNWLTITNWENGKVLTKCFSGARGEIIIPEGVTEIASNAFFGCKYLTSIRIPDSVIEIKDETFCHCIQLKSVYIPDSVQRIGKHAFLGCKNLSDVQMYGMTCVDSQAFVDCVCNHTIWVPDGRPLDGTYRHRRFDGQRLVDNVIQIVVGVSEDMGESPKTIDAVHQAFASVNYDIDLFFLNQTYKTLSDERLSIRLLRQLLMLVSNEDARHLIEKNDFDLDTLRRLYFCQSSLSLWDVVATGVCDITDLLKFYSDEIGFKYLMYLVMSNHPYIYHTTFKRHPNCSREIRLQALEMLADKYFDQYANGLYNEWYYFREMQKDRELHGGIF